MAKWYASLALAVIVLAGCQPQQHQRPMADSSLPPPSFHGPRIAQQPAPQPMPRPIPPTATRPAPPTHDDDWRPAATARAWRWIVVHHSATPAGSAGVFDKMHREKGWDELGYHFVIGNGTDSADGQIEVGPRWRAQKWGAHARTADNRYNDFGIGICLVGNFETDRPTPQQMRALVRLTAHLMRTYRISPDRVIGHSDTRATECPGRHLNVAELRRQAAQMVAETADPPPPARPAAAAEVFTDTTGR